MQDNRTLAKLLVLSALAVLVASVGGCGDSTYIAGSSSAIPPVTAKTSASLKATIDGYMAGKGTPEGVPGAIVAVKMNGYQPWYYATGSAEIDVATGAQKTAMKADMPFRIASVTKMFVAQTAILLAKEKGIDLNAKISTYLPGALTGKNAAYADEITIRQLMNHTSGLYSYVTSDAGLLNGNLPTPSLLMNKYVKSLGQSAWIHSFSPQDEVLTFVNTFNPPPVIKVPVFNNVSTVGNPYSTNPYFAPGKDMHYSNTNYYLLGLFIQAVSDSHDVAAEINRLIIAPLGLTETYLPTLKTFRNPAYVHGYTDYFNRTTYQTLMEDALLTFSLNGANSAWVNGDGVLEDFSEIDPSFPWTTGGMISSAKDLLTFSEYIMKTRVQTGQEKTEWIKAAPLTTEMTFQYARGIARVNDVMFGHGGQFAGYNVAVYWYSPLDIYFVIMTNKYSYGDDHPNELGGSIVMGADTLYKRTAKTAAARIDPNTAMINRLLDAVESDPALGKKLGKSGGASSRLPDVTSLMR